MAEDDHLDNGEDRQDAEHFHEMVLKKEVVLDSDAVLEYRIFLVIILDLLTFLFFFIIFVFALLLHIFVFFVVLFIFDFIYFSL